MRAFTIACAAAIALASCAKTPRPIPDTRLWTDAFAVRISSEPTPPSAREHVLYKVVIRDKATGEPIEGGEGQIFATSRDGVNTWDSFTAGREVGTYYAKLRFVTAGDWAIAIRFRRDSTHALERADWVQDVR
jgi:hypothetical protein